MSKSATEYIRHILDEITFVTQKSSTLTEDAFMRDETLQRAFAGLRDKLIHHYFGVDYGLVWDVVKNELPDFKIKLQPLIK